MQDSVKKAPSSLANAVVIVDRVEGLLLKSDRAAIGQSIRQFGNDVCVCSPDCDEEAIRYALAAGAKRVVSWDDCEAEVYVFGRGGAGPSGDLLPAQVASARSCHLVLEVLEFSQQADGVRVIRDLGRGAREIMTRSLPVVLVISDSATIPNYVSRYRQMSVSTKLPTGVLAKPGISKSVAWQPLRPRTKTADLIEKTAGDARNRMFTAFGLAADPLSDANDQHVISADPETCASQLVRYLAHHGFVNKRFVSPGITSAVCHDVAAAEPRPESGLPRGKKSTLPSTATIHYRVPKPLAGPVLGIARRPRPYRPLAPFQSRLARGPRPVGQPLPDKFRGPFPVNQNGPD